MSCEHVFECESYPHNCGTCAHNKRKNYYEPDMRERWRGVKGGR